MEAEKVVMTVELYAEVRRMYLEGATQRQIAKRLGIARNTVKKYILGEETPWIRKKRGRKETVLTPEVKEFIGKCLEADRQEGKKQRHTGRRIYQRLVEEAGYKGAESTIRAYLRKLKDTSGEAFVPLEFAPGEAAQIDWGEAAIWLKKEKITANLFCARLCYSQAPFVIAYRRQNEESFLDALVKMMEYFGGTPKRIIFDNARVAVRDGFGARAKATEGYAALAAHYGFQPVFCNPSSGNEKGLVEGLVGFSRRNFLVPVPAVEDMDELNALLTERSQAYLSHQVTGKSANVGILLREERLKLYSLPATRYDPAKRIQTRVEAFSTVRYETNGYSVPVRYCGKTVAIRALPERIEIWFDGEKIADHDRCFERYKNIYRLEHYLPLLERKSRAVFQAKPVRDNVPPDFLDWLSRQDFSPKTLVSLLERGLEIGFDAVMRGEIPLTPPATVITDEIPVSPVDLSAYDGLCHTGEEEMT